MSSKLMQNDLVPWREGR